MATPSDYKQSRRRPNEPSRASSGRPPTVPAGRSSSRPGNGGSHDSRGFAFTNTSTSSFPNFATSSQQRSRFHSRLQQHQGIGRGSSIGVGLGLGLGVGPGPGPGLGGRSSAASASGRTASRYAVQHPVDVDIPMYELTLQDYADNPIVPPAWNDLSDDEQEAMAQQLATSVHQLMIPLQVMLDNISYSSGRSLTDTYARVNSSRHHRSLNEWHHGAMNGTHQSFRQVPQQYPEDASMYSMYSRGDPMSIDGRNRGGSGASVPASVSASASDELSMMTDMQSVNLTDEENFDDVVFGESATLIRISNEAPDGINLDSLNALIASPKTTHFHPFWNNNLKFLHRRGFFRSKHFRDWKILVGIPVNWTPDYNRQSFWNHRNSGGDSHPARHKVLCAFWKAVFFDFENTTIIPELESVATKDPRNTKNSAKS